MKTIEKYNNSVMLDTLRERERERESYTLIKSIQ